MKEFSLTLLLLILVLTTGATAFDSNSVNATNHLSNIVQLTDEADNGEAYFSWDGKQIIWQSSRGEQKCDKIWTMKVDGSEKKMVSPPKGANTCSYFLPGNGGIVYASTAHLFDGECPPRPTIPGQHYVWPLWPYDIFKAKSDGSEVIKLTDNPAYDAEPIVSPDGKKIVFGSKREGDFDVYVMDIDGKNVTRMTKRYGYDGGPWWSPKGDMIVWRAWHPETAEEKAKWKESMDKDYIVPVPLDIWLMKSDGTGKVRLTNNGAVNWAPSFHPDGKRIIFSSNMDDWREELGRFGHNFELYMMKLDGSALERLTVNDTFDSFPMFSPDGKKLSFASNRNPDRPRQTDIFIADWSE